MAQELEKVLPDEVYAWAVDVLKSGTTIETLRDEIEAAYRHAVRMEVAWRRS